MRADAALIGNENTNDGAVCGDFVCELGYAVALTHKNSVL